MAIPLKLHAKGRQTRAAIIEAALRLAAQIGLDGLSMGAVAALTGMSKSGVFAHFGSREELQLAVIEAYHQRFEQQVFYPAMACERGMPRLRELFRRWCDLVCAEVDAGCLYVSGAAEFDDRDGVVRDALNRSNSTWLAALQRAVVQAQQTKDLPERLDSDQLVFELHGLVLALHFESRFRRNPRALERAHLGFERLVDG